VILTRNPSEQRLYNNIPNYTSAPSSAGNLSDSADSGISLSASLEQSGGGRTPPGASGAAATTTAGLTSNLDQGSNCSGSSTHLDMTSMSTSNKHTASVEPFHHHLPHHSMHEVPVTAYHPGELYGSFHIIPATATASATGTLSQHPATAAAAIIGGAGGVSPHWITTAGRVTGGGGRKPGVDLTTGDVWLKTSAVGIAQPMSIGGSTEALGNRKQLLYGMFSRYEDGTRWQCEQCKKLFSSQGSLRAHARIHTGERPYQCQYCSRTFCQASTLRSHERLHTGEKPYKCEHCGRAFTQSAGLRSHLKTHRYDSL
jgi:DNA-directed RNA polymerase subunit RPC12/RpoP